MANMSQAESILQWLEQGNTLTPAQAYEKFGTLALHSRMSELRNRGHLICCELVRVSSGKTVGKYSLLKESRGNGAVAD